jgi:hypothetical protein
MVSSLAARAAAALRWPTFVSAVLLYYWSLTLFAITYHVRWLDFRGKRNDVLGWCAARPARAAPPPRPRRRRSRSSAALPPLLFAGPWA